MFALFWEGVICGAMASIPVILLVWHVITPAMKKEVIEFLQRRLTYLKEDTEKAHYRTY